MIGPGPRWSARATTTSAIWSSPAYSLGVRSSSSAVSAAM
jgi:hypothetical protein